MKAKQTVVTLYRNEDTRTIMYIQPNGDLEFVRHESSSDDQIRVRAKDRKAVLASLLSRSGQGLERAVNSDEFLTSKLKSLFGSGSGDPFDDIDTFLKESNSDCQFSIWSNQ